MVMGGIDHEGRTSVVQVFVERQRSGTVMWPFYHTPILVYTK